MFDEDEDMMEVLAMLQAEEDGEDMEAWTARRSKQIEEREKKTVPFISSVFFDDEDEDVRLRDMLELQEALAELQEEEKL